MADALALVGDSEKLLLAPVGRLGVLPLHAAWRPDQHRRPGACMPATGARSATPRTHAAPAVRAPNPTAGSWRLPIRHRCHRVLSRLLSLRRRRAPRWLGIEHGTVLSGEGATKRAVSQALPDASIYHFACHGLANLREPRRSALMLGGGQLLTVGELLELRLTGRLAILTACETALAGDELPDEVVSLPAALIRRA